MGKEERRRTQAAPMTGPNGCPECHRTHSIRPGRGGYEVQVVGRCRTCKLPYYETQVSEAGEREVK